MNEPSDIDIRERRRAVGLSQEQLARAVGCSTASVRLFERGYMPPSSPTRERVVAVLNALVKPRND